MNGALGLLSSNAFGVLIFTMLASSSSSRLAVGVSVHFWR
jgi:hypothetical protein